MRSQIELYGFECPFVERVQMALIGKGLDYDHYLMDDFSHATEWFQTLNPNGQVPVLVHIWKSSL